MVTAHAARISDELVVPQIAPEQLEHLKAATGGAVNVGLTMLHHPALAQRYREFGISFLTDGTLPARDRELIILRTSWLCRSAYEWAHHTRIGQECGITEEEIRRVMTTDLDHWHPADAELLAAVDAVVGDHTLTEEQWARLSDRYGTAGAIEVVMLAGHYAMLAAILNSAGTRVEPGIEVSIPLG
jgi:4-carboxymuconolactone decarboxylase